MRKWIFKLLGLVPEAPHDGRSYVRRDREWVAIADVASDSELNRCVADALKSNQ